MVQLLWVHRLIATRSARLPVYNPDCQQVSSATMHFISWMSASVRSCSLTALLFRPLLACTVWAWRYCPLELGALTSQPWTSTGKFFTSAKSTLEFGEMKSSFEEQSWSSHLGQAQDVLPDFLHADVALGSSGRVHILLNCIKCSYKSTGKLVVGMHLKSGA